ncbi:MAG TPA: hypothetical protein VGM88_28140 [Kofleriaceae bacterium]
MSAGPVEPPEEPISLEVPKIRRQVSFATIAGGLYLLSLCLPAVIIRGDGFVSDHETLYGFHCVVLGWIEWPGWIANILLLLGALSVTASPRLAKFWGWLAVTSAMFAPVEMYRDELLAYPHVGYFCWLASCVCFLIHAQRMDDQRRRDDESREAAVARLLR